MSQINLVLFRSATAGSAGGTDVCGEESESLSVEGPARNNTSALESPLSSLGLLLLLILFLSLLLSLKDGTKTGASALKE